MKYHEVYQRNYGLFSDEEQEKIMNSKIAIAGVGGVGGEQAKTLARFGIGELSILDPGVFDAPDMNRQFGAITRNIGRNKAIATAEMLKERNPFLKVNIFTQALDTQKGIEEFIGDSDLVIDAIDYMGFDYKVMFAKVAREKGLYNLSAPIPDFGALMMIFDPKGMTFEEFHKAPKKREEQAKYKVPHEVYFGKNRFPKNLQMLINGETNYISTNSGAAELSGALAGTEAIFILTGKRQYNDIVKIPMVSHVDMLSRTYDKFNPMKD